MGYKGQDHIRIDAAAVKASVNILTVAQSYGLQFRRAGREQVCLSPFKAERTPSFYIDEHKGLFKDFASGEGGDVIRFVQLMEGIEFGKALSRLAADAGMDVDEKLRAERAAAYRAKQLDDEQRGADAMARNIGYAYRIWTEARSAHGTLVETYLEARGIDLAAIEQVYGWRVPGSLRFHPALPYRRQGELHCGPAMLGIAMREILGVKQFAGVHRTWLSKDGTAKASLSLPKMTLGAMFGSQSRLSPVSPLAVVGEGYETTLSVMGELARHGEVVFGVSGLFLGNVSGAGARGNCERGISIAPDDRRPGLMMPEGVEEVILLKDADGKNPADIDRFMRRAATKFQRAGLRVRVASPEMGKDFNDMVREEAA